MKRLVAGLCLVVALGACSSSSKNSSSASSTTAAPSATVAVTAAASAGVSTGGICGEKGQLAALANAGPGTNYQQLLTQEDEALNRIKGQAPSDIRADVNVVFNAFHTFYLAFKADNYDYTKLTPAQISAIQSPSVKAASDRIQAWYSAHCK